MSTIPFPAPPVIPPGYAQALARLAPRPVAELNALPPRDWLVPDVLPAGEPA